MVENGMVRKFLVIHVWAENLCLAGKLAVIQIVLFGSGCIFLKKEWAGGTGISRFLSCADFQRLKKHEKWLRPEGRSHLQLVKKLVFCTAFTSAQGELEGAKPASNWIKCPGSHCAARSSARQKGFSCYQATKGRACFQTVKKVRSDFFDSLRTSPPAGGDVLSFSKNLLFA